MRTTVGVFASSMFFGIAISIAYWFSSYDWIGTILLGIMSAGFLFASSYTSIAQRKSRLLGDDKNASPSGTIGVFTIESPWPILLGISAAAFLIGIVLQPWLAAIGTIVFFYAITMMIQESS
jgi:hypothetical protein